MNRIWIIFPEKQLDVPKIRTKGVGPSDVSSEGGALWGQSLRRLAGSPEVACQRVGGVRRQRDDEGGRRRRDKPKIDEV
jgi:hypothetical protein